MRLTARLRGDVIRHEPKPFEEAMDWRWSVQDSAGVLLFSAPASPCRTWEQAMSVAISALPVF
jgi:hypothetical protein